ncbi:MAG: CaiB/BaiF CoA transferase family protein, partial [Methyloligellaceae bacterium]
FRVCPDPTVTTFPARNPARPALAFGLNNSFAEDMAMKAFEGVRVLDFTHVFAGPFATYQLAVMGADVIKIEDPSEIDMMRPESVSPALAAEGRGTRYVCQSGNKRAVTIDLKSEAGRDLIRRMAETSDVVVSNFRNGVMDRLGIGADALQAVNPQLIYCTVSGFGATGPKAKDPAYDNVIQAYSGLMASTGTPTSGPVKIGPAVLDYGTGAQAAFAIAAALFQRTRTGTGQRIDVAMLDAALMLMPSSVADTHALDAPPKRIGNTNPVKAAYGVFDTSDGSLMVGAFTIRQTERLWRAVGRDDKADALDGVSMTEMDATAEDDRALLQEIFLTKSADDWETILNDGGVPGARVRDIHEAIGSAQVASRQVLQEGVVMPETDRPIATPMAAFSYAHNGPELTRHSARHGEHTIEVLGEFGIDASEIALLQKSGVI